MSTVEVKGPLHDAWTIALDARNENYFERERYQQAMDTTKEVLHPVLLVLEGEDLPVKEVYWSFWCREIVLHSGVALTQDALNKIKKLTKSKHVTRGADESRVSWSFGNQNSTNRYRIKITNGDGTCQVIKTPHIRHIDAQPARDEVYYSFEPGPDCESANLKTEEG